MEGETDGGKIKRDRPETDHGYVFHFMKRLDIDEPLVALHWTLVCAA